MNNLRIIRLKEVMELTGLSKTTIYEQMRTGNFPAGRKIGTRAVGWPSTEIEQWLQARGGECSSIEFLFQTGRMQWKQATARTLEDLYWEIDSAGHDPFDVPILFLTSSHPMRFAGSALKSSDRGPLRLTAI
ncbi:phage transcriptional regulator, AlpA [Pseudogulbenkiania sp. NH8B]|uniref:helix-turn-helix transcriptional regulator n=1 Tax=Pseudogulbenkiania sp. (strain NH8B) TaxID=748280 RepID=UPI0002279594|nr:AlpA family transcriptional regulator [Pseudogulbenkiania sp. NH8B]BAK75431.1 phage transcriptional regulator, AlpA [Pseudogulbenkiania sp. NH8B]